MCALRLPRHGWRLREPDYLLLLATLFVLLTLGPHWRDRLTGRLLYQTIATLVFLSSLRVHRDRRWLYLSAMIVGGISLPFSWATVFWTDFQISVASDVLNAAFTSMLGMMILMDVIVVRRAGMQSIAGTLCAYLLIGLTFAYLYAALDEIDPDTISFSHQRATLVDDQPHTEFNQLLYFSFVTMSTLGYGDIHPQSSAAQTLAWIQSVAGQFYLAVLVAWLVSSLPPHGDRSDK